MLAAFGFAMVAVFMFLIMSKRATPVVGLIAVPGWYREVLNDAVRVLTEAARLTNQPGRQKPDGSWEPDPNAEPLAIDWAAYTIRRIGPLPRWGTDERRIPCRQPHPIPATGCTSSPSVPALPGFRLFRRHQDRCFEKPDLAAMAAGPCQIN